MNSPSPYAELLAAIAGGAPASRRWRGESREPMMEAAMSKEMFAPLRGPDARAIRHTLEEAMQYCANGGAEYSICERLGVMWAATWWAEAVRRKQETSQASQ